MSRNLTAHRNLKDYAGVYSNSAYGTLSIYVNETADALMMENGYAKYVLYAKTEKDEFFAEGAGLIENIRSFSTLQFGTVEGNTVITTLTVSSF